MKEIKKGSNPEKMMGGKGGKADAGKTSVSAPMGKGGVSKDGGKVVSKGAVSKDGGKVMSKDGGKVVSKDGGKVVSKGGGKVVSKGAVSKDGGKAGYTKK